MYCRYCGAQIPDDSRFCEKCGGQLGAPAAAQGGYMQQRSAPSAQQGYVQNGFPPQTGYQQGYGQQGYGRQASGALLKDAGIEVLQIGERLTKGRGTGGVAEIGEKAAENDIARLEQVLKDVDLVFITAGMGGGVGTGAAPVIARLVK